MNLFFALFAIAATIILPGCQTQSAQSPNEVVPTVSNESKSARSSVLVELFTSEGCSSCPPADRLLSSLAKDQPIKDVEVITLGFHVDYWDSGSWRDRFSSAEYTRRQQSYVQQFGLGSSYTPQAVVDGATDVVGNNRERINAAITSNATLPKASINAKIADNKLGIEISEIPIQKGATVYLAVAESKLASNVSGGENSGSRLTHVSVVRELRSIGKIAAGQKTFKIETALPIDGAWKVENVKYVVFVQDNTSLHVLAATQIGR